MSFSKESNTKQATLQSALFQYIKNEENTENIKDALDVLIDLEEEGLRKN